MAESQEPKKAAQSDSTKLSRDMAEFAKMPVVSGADIRKLTEQIQAQPVTNKNQSSPDKPSSGFTYKLKND
jgi:hypothetical protein